MRIKPTIFIIVIITFLISSNPCLAFHFDKNYLISDADLTDQTDMSQGRIQEFLSSKGSLGSYITETVNGVQKRASEVIYDACQHYNLNPKYFLVRVQLEQSLITDRTPSQRQLDWATGYGCPDGGSCNEEYRGFYNQINKSAESIRGDSYLGGLDKWNSTISGWGVGRTKTTLDGIEVTPENKATAVLYTYTPWVGKQGGGDQQYGGNSLLVDIWQEWFERHYPNGSLVRAQGETGIYLIYNNKKRPFWSRSAFYANYDPSQVITVSKSELDAYETADPIKYPEFSLLQTPSGGIYLYANGEKRAITSREIFRQLGFNPEEVLPATWAELDQIPEGDKITQADNYPTGALLQSRQTGAVTYVKNGQSYPIWDRAIMNSRFKSQNIIKVDQSEINRYPIAHPLKFKDGTLVTSPGTKAVYVITDGEKRPFASRDAFDQMGYQWNNIINTTDQALTLHPTGDPITLE